MEMTKTHHDYGNFLVTLHNQHFEYFLISINVEVERIFLSMTKVYYLTLVFKFDYCTIVLSHCVNHAFTHKLLNTFNKRLPNFCVVPLFET